jgi:hypothetical protein
MSNQAPHKWIHGNGFSVPLERSEFEGLVKIRNSFGGQAAVVNVLTKLPDRSFDGVDYSVRKVDFQTAEVMAINNENWEENPQTPRTPFNAGRINDYAYHARSILRSVSGLSNDEQVTNIIDSAIEDIESLMLERLPEPTDDIVNLFGTEGHQAEAVKQYRDRFGNWDLWSAREKLRRCT